MKNRFKSITLLVAVLRCLSTVGFAQETTGSIEGTIKDPAGAVVPNVTVTITNAKAAVSGTTTTGVGAGFKRTSTSNTKESSTDSSPVPIAGNGKIFSVIGKGSTFKGDIVCEGGARIDGSFEGSLLVKGPLVIGENARIVANITADAVSVGGSVKGNITAKKVDIMRTGRIYGDLITGSFTTEEGGFLRGQVRMTDGSGQAEEELPIFSARPALPVSS